MGISQGTMYQSIGHDNSEKKWAKWGLASSVIANVALAGAVCMVAFGNTEPTLESTAMRVAPQVAPMVHIAPRNVFQGANFRRNLRMNAEESLGFTGYIPYPDTTGASLTPLPAKQEASPYSAELRETAKAIVADGKGILACDESTKTIGKRLEQIGVPNEETLYQNAEDGTPFVDIMKANNVIPGIKVDTGVRATFMDGETITEGIDGLAERAAKYYKQGARFAK